MNPGNKTISIIHNCEKNFFDWLKIRLDEKGITLHEQNSLSDLLTHHENSLIEMKQHLKPLLKWNKNKDECISLSKKLNGSADTNESLLEMMEKTAFEGQVLWLTLQED